MCPFCKKFDFSAARADVDKYGASIVMAGGLCRFPEKMQFNFCPVCGDSRKKIMKNRKEDNKDGYYL